MRLHGRTLPHATAARSLVRAIPALLCTAWLSAVPFASARAGETGEAGAAADDAKSGLSSAPDFTGTGVDGKTYNLAAALKKGPVLLDFWATYCKPCMMELPQVQKIWERHRGQGFTLLTVAGDDQRTIAKLKPLVQSKGFKFPTLVDTDKKINNLYNVRNYPTSVLIAPDGKIVLSTLGYTPGTEKDLEAKIVALLPAPRDEKAPAEKSEGQGGGSN
jgi:peroxiredoxin